MPCPFRPGSSIYRELVSGKFCHCHLPLLWLQTLTNTWIHPTGDRWQITWWIIPGNYWINKLEQPGLYSFSLLGKEVTYFWNSYGLCKDIKLDKLAFLDFVYTCTCICTGTGPAGSYYIYVDFVMTLPFFACSYCLLVGALTCDCCVYIFP